MLLFFFSKYNKDNKEVGWKGAVGLKVGELRATMDGVMNNKATASFN